MGRLSKELKPKRDSRGLRISNELLETAKLDDRPLEMMAAESVIVIRAADLPAVDWQKIFAAIRGAGRT